MKSEMNSREAIYLFCGWLTSRNQVTEMGSTKDCAGIPELIEEFCNKNNLPVISERYPYFVDGFLVQRKSEE